MLDEVRVEPSGLRMLTVVQHHQPGNVEFESRTLANWPAVPLNVSCASCPGVLITTCVPEVPDETGVIGIVCSLNRDRVTFALPVPPLCGAITRVYVPLVGNTTGPTKKLSVLHILEEVRVEPSGLRMLTVTE